MHTVELLEQATALVKQLGYAVREESLAGCGGGGCELKGRKVFFLDLDLGPDEQLEQMLDTLRREPQLAQMTISPELLRTLAEPAGGPAQLPEPDPT